MVRARWLALFAVVGLAYLPRLDETHYRAGIDPTAREIDPALAAFTPCRCCRR